MDNLLNQSEKPTRFDSVDWGLSDCRFGTELCGRSFQMSASVLYRDLIPYELPTSLAALSGASSGVIELPISVHWGPQASYEVSVRSELIFAYQQIVREASSAFQEQLLNADRLLQVWDQLILPARCRALWEQKFPELHASHRS